MNEIYIRFYGNLNTFLPSELKQKRIMKQLEITSSIKDIIESYNVPNKEVQLILVNSQKEDFHYKIKNGDDCSIYPYFYNLDAEEYLHKTNTSNKFIADVHLGDLAKYLRILGIDVYYSNLLSGAELIKIANDEDRVLLTHSVNILKNNHLVYGCYIYKEEIFGQLNEVIARYKLKDKLNPFTLCSVCNGKLEDVNKNEIEAEIPDKVRDTQNEFKRCTVCSKIYWKGSHYSDIMISLKTNNII